MKIILKILLSSAPKRLRGIYSICELELSRMEYYIFTADTPLCCYIE